MTQGSGRGRRAIAVVTVTVVVLLGLAGGMVMLTGRGEERLSSAAVTPPESGRAATVVSAADLQKVARTRVFFAHQSVGMNVLDGIPMVYEEHGLPAPVVTQTRSVTTAAGTGVVAHTMIGENTKPLGKIEDFATAIRGGVGAGVDVAVLKLCYVDVTAGTDVDALFATYRDTLTALEREFPDVAFVKTTVPLTAEPGRLSRLKARLTGNNGEYDHAANAARQRLNALIRREYADGQLLDLAAVESTTPDGARTGGTIDGQPYYSLFSGYAKDEGHLNAEGSRRAAAAWLVAVAGASSR